MKRAYIIRMVLLVLGMVAFACAGPPPDPTPVGTATAAPTATETPVVNLLSNPSFEEGFDDIEEPGKPQRKQPIGWTVWHIETASHAYPEPTDEEIPACYNHYPNIYPVDDPANAYDGTSWLFEVAFQSFEAGLYQRVAVPIGEVYEFEVMARAFTSDASSPMAIAVGIDPTGGTNPASDAVVWSLYDRVNEDPDLGASREWSPVGIRAFAVADYVTVYTKAFGRWCVQRNEAYYDDASLIRIE